MLCTVTQLGMSLEEACDRINVFIKCPGMTPLAFGIALLL
jgi:hypothetical protein